MWENLGLAAAFDLYNDLRKEKEQRVGKKKVKVNFLLEKLFQIVGLGTSGGEKINPGFVIKQAGV